MKRSHETCAKYVAKWTAKLSSKNVVFVDPDTLVTELMHFEGSPSMLVTKFKRTDVDYVRPKPVRILCVLTGVTNIWTPEERSSHLRKRSFDNCSKIIDRWTSDLAMKHVAFVNTRETLITQLMQFKGPPTDMITTFKRTDIDYIHPNPVTVSHVFSGHTKIWTPEEKEQAQKMNQGKHTSRGVDWTGDRETERFHMYLELCPELENVFSFSDTVRGSMVDFIATFKKNPDRAVGFQICTSIRTSGGQFNFKPVGDMIRYIQNNLIVIFIGVVDNELVGVYIIPPSDEVLAELETHKTTHRLCLHMLSRTKTSSRIGNYLHKFRYLTPKHTNGVNGSFKTLSESVIDLFDIITNFFTSVVQTPLYLSSLFVDDLNRTEWACNQSFDISVLPLLEASQTIHHGARGDMWLDFNDFRILDERKILRVHHSKNGWALALRNPGQQGLHPSKVHVTTGFIRSDRIARVPSNAEDIIGFILLPVLTSDGHLAIRPDNPKANGIFLVCEPGSEWVRISVDKIGKNTYPNEMTRPGPLSKHNATVEIRAAFYYDTLKPNSDRLLELVNLYKDFASRVPTQEAIDAFANAVTDELIEAEKSK